VQRNDRTKRFRVAWADLNAVERTERFRRAVQAHTNGVLRASPGSFDEYAKRQEWLDGFQRTASATSRKLLPMPALFDSPERTLILAMLATNGPMTVREIARARQVDAGSTYRSTERLIRCGLAVKRHRAGGRKYVALHRAHIAAAPLRALLDVLAGHYGTPILPQLRYRHGLPLDRDPRPPLAEERMFGSPIRSRMLVLLAGIGEADVTQLARLLAADVNSIHYAAHALLKSGVLGARRVGARHVLSLSDAYVGAGEFRAFLMALLDAAPSYVHLGSLIPGITRRWR
jgi:DNA-binding MarR family transcriptional regulator